MKRFTFFVFNIILKAQLKTLGSASSRKLRKVRVHDIYFGHLTRSKIISKSIFLKSNINTSGWTLVGVFLVTKNLKKPNNQEYAQVFVVTCQKPKTWKVPFKVSPPPLINLSFMISSKIGLLISGPSMSNICSSQLNWDEQNFYDFL